VHIPDGYVNAPVAVAGGVVATVGVGLCGRRARASLGERDIPLAGLCAAFFLLLDAPIFPVGAGSSAHLLGGTLAVALLGPWLGAVVMTVTTVVQALFLGDGGTTALGLNVTNLALVPACAGYPVIIALVRLLPRSPRATAIACGVAALVSVLVAALLFSVEYWIGGTVGVPPMTMAAGVLGTYTVVGVLEAVVTAVIVRAVLALRPDLVRAHRRRDRTAAR
jgi:cobalt/nickel transport system permease protein